MAEARRQLGSIDGGYQHHALERGPRIQRFWHRIKLGLLDWVLLPQPGERILDLGCGSGVIADRLGRCGADVLGVDANPNAVEYAREHFGSNRVRFELAEVEALELEPNSFDAAVCLEMVEHVHPEQVDSSFAAVHAALSAGGRLMVTTPNYRGLWPAVEWAADRFATTAQMDQEQHINRYDRCKLRRQLSDAGFRIELLQTFSTFAPFVASISRRVATAVDRVERRIDLPFGNILVALGRKE